MPACGAESETNICQNLSNHPEGDGTAKTARLWLLEVLLFILNQSYSQYNFKITLIGWLKYLSNIIGLS